MGRCKKFSENRSSDLTARTISVRPVSLETPSTRQVPSLSQPQAPLSSPSQTSTTGVVHSYSMSVASVRQLLESQSPDEQSERRNAKCPIPGCPECFEIVPELRHHLHVVHKGHGKAVAEVLLTHRGGLSDGNPLYRCQICPNVNFDTLSGLQDHLSEITNHVECRDSAKRMKDWLFGIITSFYLCLYCNSSFDESSSLMGHMKEKHDSSSELLRPDDTFECIQCNYRCMSYRALDDHHKATHVPLEKEQLL